MKATTPGRPMENGWYSAVREQTAGAPDRFLHILIRGIVPGSPLSFLKKIRHSITG